MGCTSSTDRELASRLDAQSRSIAVLEPTALRAWLEEARKEASALFLAFRAEQDFDLMQSHGAARSTSSGGPRRHGSKYHDTYGDLGSRVDALHAEQIDLVNRWAAAGGGDKLVEGQIVGLQSLLALAERVDQDAFL